MDPNVVGRVISFFTPDPPSPPSSFIYLPLFVPLPISIFLSLSVLLLNQTTHSSFCSSFLRMRMTTRELKGRPRPARFDLIARTQLVIFESCRSRLLKLSGSIISLSEQLLVEETEV